MTANTEELFTKARAGDGQAFAGLVEAHGADVLRLCMLITTNQMMAQDAAQNAWHQIWRNLHTVREPTRLRSWILKIAANESKQALRRDRRHSADRLEAVSEMPSRAATEEDAILHAALRHLSSEERELLALRYAVGMTSQEIAAQQGLSAEGVRSRLKTLRDRLQEELR